MSMMMQSKTEAFPVLCRLNLIETSMLQLNERFSRIYATPASVINNHNRIHI